MISKIAHVAAKLIGLGVLATLMICRHCRAALHQAKASIADIQASYAFGEADIVSGVCIATPPIGFATCVLCGDVQLVQLVQPFQNSAGHKWNEASLFERFRERLQY